MSGWIKLHRQIYEHWIWQDPVKLKWWLDIIISVNHTEKLVNIGNSLIECKRGQTIRSLSGWADRWKTSKDSTRNFLVLLQKDNMIILENLTKTTRLTVCKYDDYQEDLHASQTQAKRKPNASQTQPIHKQESKENKELKKENNIYRSFDHLTLSIIEYEKLLIDYSKKDIDNILDSIQNYKKNKSYVSLYLTAKNWLARDSKKTNQNGNTTGFTKNRPDWK